MMSPTQNPKPHKKILFSTTRLWQVMAFSQKQPRLPFVGLGTTAMPKYFVRTSFHWKLGSTPSLLSL